MVDVLVVADGAWVINGIRSALDDGSFSLEVVDDPRTVNGATASLRDLIVVDLQIGSMGGMAVTRAIRAACSKADVVVPPIILLLDRAADAFLAKRAGADAWVRKPLQGFELREVADRLVAASAESA